MFKNILSFLVLFILSNVLVAQSVAFSFNDGPKINKTPYYTAIKRNMRILKALKDGNVKAVLFVTWNNGANKKLGYKMLEEWDKNGHYISNHTMTHIDLNKKTTSIKDYQREIISCANKIKVFKGYEPWFRFTYLREGNTEKKVKAMRLFLKNYKMKNGYVTIDTSDWRINQALIKKLKKEPKASLKPFKKIYLKHIKERSIAYEGISKKIFGRNVPHILLLHHNLINSLFLKDLIEQFREMGWKIKDPKESYKDFIYTLAPQRLKSGQSLLISISRTLGYKPKNWKKLLDDGDAEIKELKDKGIL